MNAFHRTDLPSTAKVMSLVRLHHGIPSLGGEEVPVPSKTTGRLGRIWKVGARLNHLTARRRRVTLEKLPSVGFPVILELAGGSNFIIVHERSAPAGEGEQFLVQFPDSREALVRADRLRELYDGTCVSLSPEAPGRRGLLARMRARFLWFC